MNSHDECKTPALCALLTKVSEELMKEDPEHFENRFSMFQFFCWYVEAMGEKGYKFLTNVGAAVIQAHAADALAEKMYEEHQATLDPNALKQQTVVDFAKPNRKGS